MDNLKPYSFEFKIGRKPFPFPFIRYSTDLDTARKEFTEMAYHEWPGQNVTLVSINEL